jgi:dipeptidyl aminopeptidase/acylaminoacyl peptidase
MRIIALLMCSLVAGTLSSARTITFDDLYSLPACSDPQISPDGRRITFVLQTSDLTTHTRHSQLWMMNADGTGLVQMTHDSAGKFSPRWAPDGSTLLFLSDGDTGTQVWALPASGGEPKAVTSLATEVSSFECLPSGDGLLIVSRVFPDCDTDSCNQARSAEQEAMPVKARLFDRLLFRHYNRWADGRVKRLFVTDLTDGSHRVVAADTHDVPTALLGGHGDYAVSADGRQICFAMCTDSMPAVRVNNDLYIVLFSGGEAVRLTDAPGLEVSPRYSPNGRYLAYHAVGRAGYESDQRDLMIYNRETDQHSNITADFDLSVGAFAWGPRTKSVYFSAIDRGYSKIFRVDIPSQKTEMLLGDANYDDLRVSPDGEYLLVQRSRSDEPSEIYRFDMASRRLTRLTYFTDDVVKDLDMSRAEEFWFTGAAGDSVHGFMVKPPGLQPDKRYPLALLIHGGPQWCWLGDFNYYGWNTQLVAAQGYVVAQINPHGSLGYGLEFKEYVSGNWGKGDYEDIMKGIDFLIAHYPFIDSTRMAALGRSYGGFMVNWICGHSDRFRCLVSVDGCFDHISDYGSTDELWFPEWEYKGTPWNNPEEYVRSSPSTYAGNFRTPTMVIHGQRDYRVDVSQGLQMFTALQRMGVPSQLLYFPDEGHNVHKLENLRYAYETQFEWLARWLKP